MVNGVVMENGTRRTRINILTADSHVLRLRDAIHPGEATTPVRRVCYIAQLVLAGEAEPEEAEAQIRSGIDQLAQVFTDVDSHERLSEARAELEEGRFYQALKSLRKLLPLEERLMGAPNP
ncbi:MAG: flagellar biosynthesis repressor FlbT [Pseudomonadota bacterium]